MGGGWEGGEDALSSTMVAYALRQSFTDADRWSCRREASSAVLESGACAVAAVLLPGCVSSHEASLVVCNCGDCRATLETADGAQIDLSKDQKASDLEEQGRMEAAARQAGHSGEIQVVDKYGYALGEMACASTIGDADVKSLSRVHAAVFVARPECQVA